jgi:cobalt-zinc-cadmium efflux system membrane fusion protein
MRRSNLLIVLLLLPAMLAWTPVRGGVDLAHDHDAADHVRLTPAVQAEFGIRVAAAGPAMIEQTVSLPGEVRPDADRLVHITPRYDGIVTEVRAELGDRVAAGQVLAVVENDATLAPYSLQAGLAGTVIAKHLVRGEAVGRGEAVYVVADLSRVWVDLSVFQRDLARVAPGQAVRLFLDHDLAGPEATIAYMTPVVDPETRTATARVVLDNAGGRWRPGMFLTGEVVVERRLAAVAVPVGAVQTVHGGPAVFVAEDDAFHARPVRVGSNDAAHVEIVAGLAAGELVAVAGAFVLKAELEKAAFDDGHNH